MIVSRVLNPQKAFALSDNINWEIQKQVFFFPLQEPRFMSQEARITLDCSVARNWCELDAIQVRGTQFKTRKSVDAKHQLNAIRI